MSERGPGVGEAEARRVDRRVRRRRRRRRMALRWLVRLAVLAVVFAVGLSIGRALEDAPRPGGTQTLVRTLEPGTLGPVQETVTVTVSAG